jgi:hypothetical protein
MFMLPAVLALAAAFSFVPKRSKVEKRMPGLALLLSIQFYLINGVCAFQDYKLFHRYFELSEQLRAAERVWGPMTTTEAASHHMEVARVRALETAAQNDSIRREKITRLIIDVDGGVALLVLGWLLVSEIRLSRQSTAWDGAAHCPACGYDLRASGGRFPECGTAKAVTDS